MSVPLEMVAATFHRAAEQEFAESEHWSFLARHIESDQELLELAAGARPGEFPPYLLLAAVHQLVLKGEAPELEPFHPSVGGNRSPDHDFFLAFRQCALSHRVEVSEVVARRNVNKTVLRRCACLRPLLIEVARKLETDKVHLIDIGCSAGLNLLLDRWSVVYEPGQRGGPVDAPVTVATELRGPLPPLDGMPQIVERIGLDLDRIDMADPDDSTWILGNLFPDDTDFDITLRAAQELLHAPPKFIIGDAAITLPGTIQELDDSIPVVLMQSILGFHFNTRQRIELLRGANEAARERRVARITMSSIPSGDAQLTLAVGDLSQPVPVGTASRDATWLSWNG